MDPIYESISANKRWTYVFFFLYAILIGIIGYLIGIYLGSPILGIIMAAIIIVLILLVSYYGGEKVVTSMANAREVSKQEEPYLYNTVEGLSIAAGLPMPKLYIIDTEVPNAFATGRNPENASITVTSGLLERLDRLELEGVIAHEMSHIKNYDVLLATIAVVLAGTIVFLGYMARHSAYGGLFRGGSRSGPAALILVIIFIVLIVLAPIFAQLLKFAISRKREFLADATGADLTGYPEGLASALEKISALQEEKSKIQNEALNGLYIINPAVGSQNRSSNLFSTHPPIEERIRQLREMEFIDPETYTTPKNTTPIQSSSETTSNSSKFVGLTDKFNLKHVGEGYLVCDKCKGYYKLQPGESPEDFTNRCECGGKLEYHDRI